MEHVQPPFVDRHSAGRAVGAKLMAHSRGPDVVVLALSRGGVPVAYEVARTLEVPLDVFVVRKLGVPGSEELAMGFVATGGVQIEDDALIAERRIPEYVVDAVATQERLELERRERLYRGGRPPPDTVGKTVIVVDDGLTSAATMQTAIAALRHRGPGRIVVALPIALHETLEQLRSKVDEVLWVATPVTSGAIGRWYEDPSQASDEDVRALLAKVDRTESNRPSFDVEGPIERDVRDRAHMLNGTAHDYDRLLALIGDARFALLGEASHGTHEFYRERAEITKRLVVEKGYRAIAIEGDWPDAYRVDRYVRGRSDDRDAAEALSGFQRFPSWMWRNTDVVEFVEWLRHFNDAEPHGTPKVGFYGLDLYSLHASMKAVLGYLEKVDLTAAKKAQERYACFDHFGDDTQIYGFATGIGMAKSCELEVVTQLVDLQRRSLDALKGGGADGEEEHFYAEQNARLVKNAERYYRSMYLEEVSAWNLRDRHMTETLESVAAYLGRSGGVPKIAVWAHNSHVGDARATDLGRRGELTIGQLVREKYGAKAVLVGFTTHRGTVTAASTWGGPAERKRVRSALPESHEALFHRSGRARFLLTLRDDTELHHTLHDLKLERAIGVIYRPGAERGSHYFFARIPAQFDAVLHFDKTRAVEPLEQNAEWKAGEAPETFPFGV